MAITVLLPTFNQAAFLPDALDGLAAQTRRDFELIACDDASTDATPKILATYEVRTLTHYVNKGTAAAINSAAALATDSRYMTWISSDNLMHPSWLDTLGDVLDEHANVGAVYSAFNWCEGEHTKTIRPGPYHPDRLIATEDCYFGPSFLIRRSVWQDHRGKIAHDYDNWTRVEEACWAKGLTIGYIDEPLCDYRVHPDRASVRMRHLYDAPLWRAEAQLRRKWAPVTSPPRPSA